MSQSESSRSGGQAQTDVVAIQQRSPLDEALREGARQMLLKAIEDEVAAYIDAHQDQVDENGRRLVVRNGHARERTLVTGVGTIAVQAPRVEDRRVDEKGHKRRFSSQILPPYLRRTKSVEELIPWLYLKGISTGDFSEALEALLGRMRRGCRRRRWCGSRRSGAANTRAGRSARSPANVSSICGPMEFIRIFVSMTSANACWW